VSLVSCCVCTVALCCAHTCASDTTLHAHFGAAMSYRKKKVQLEAKAEKHMDLAKKAALPAGWK
jgi:hypothetical protein